MLIDFFQTLRAARLPVSVKEYLMLLEALKAGVLDDEESGPSVERFYFLARSALVKDEANFDKFDRAFSAYFKGVQRVADFTKELPLEWLRKHLELELTPEQKAAIEKMGWDELMETLKKRFEEQKERHEGGNRMIGTGGTSPFGAYGYNPQGIRIGQDKGRNRSAVKVWDQRAYADYDDTKELGTRNIKVALRRLRRFAREGSELELDLDHTIHSTAANAGTSIDLPSVTGMSSRSVPLGRPRMPSASVRNASISSMTRIFRANSRRLSSSLACFSSFLDSTRSCSRSRKILSLVSATSSSIRRTVRSRKSRRSRS